MGFPLPRPPPPPKVDPEDTYRIDKAPPRFKAKDVQHELGDHIDEVFRERSSDDPFGDRTSLHVLGVLIGFIVGAIAGAAAVLLSF